MIPHTDNPPWMTAKDVADLLGWSRPTFLRRRTRLEAEGFPTMLPGRFGRWDRDAIERWFRDHAELKRLAAANRNQPVRIAYDRARLTQIFARGVLA